MLSENLEELLCEILDSAASGYEDPEVMREYLIETGDSVFELKAVKELLGWRVVSSRQYNAWTGKSQ